MPDRMVRGTMIRQPIVSVLGHVDHGKCVAPSTLLHLEDGEATAEELYRSAQARYVSLWDARVLVPRRPPRLLSLGGDLRARYSPAAFLWKLTAPKVMVETRLCSGSRLVTTPEHPFLVEGLRYRPASRLSVGDRVVTVDESATEFTDVVDVRPVDSRGSYVYDFSVPRLRNFIAEGTVVHNTTLLDRIRGTGVAGREAGAITQHIGATEVPLEAIYNVCRDLLGDRKFKVPGLLFIDTPGHHAFTTLRARGGALADLAVLVVDINEGPRPQTVESLRILKRYKTPFVVAANKIDLIPGWRRRRNEAFVASYQQQPDVAKTRMDEKLYSLVGHLYEQSFSSDRYDQIEDFRNVVAIVPISAKFGEGVPDLLLVLIGLAQRFLEEELRTEEGPGAGTILEVKEERGLGLTLDAILYSGTLRKGDSVVLGTPSGRPRATKVRALLKPKPLDEIRDPENRFDQVELVRAAAGIKIAAADLEGVAAGAPLRVVGKDPNEAMREVEEETKLEVELSEDGITIKGDALGSLEGLAYQMKEEGLTVRQASLGPVSRRDVVEAATVQDPMKRVVLAFNVPVLADAQEELRKQPGVDVIEGDVIYKLIEDYQTWRGRRKAAIEAAKRREVVFPGKILLLPDYVFRTSKPAIVGIRVLAGRVRVAQSLLRDDGRIIGKIKSMRSGEQSLQEVITGSEVALAIEGPTVGRQINPGDVLYVEIPEGHVRILEESGLNQDELDVLEEVKGIKRKEDPFWGM